MSATLAFVGGATLLAGLAFARVGLALRARAIERSDDARAMRSFATWWIAMGASTLCVAAMPLVALLPGPPVLAVAALRAVSLLLLSWALTGLLSHVAYVYRGRNLERPIGLAYAVLFAVFLAHYVWVQPSVLVTTGWTVEVEGIRDEVALQQALLVGAYLLPPIGAGIAYLRLLPRLAPGPERRRLRVVGWGIVLWVSTHLLARANEAGLWQFVTRVGIGLGVASAVWQAYVGASTPRGFEHAFQERMRQLI